MKGQINIVELIFVLVALLIAFGVFFPRFVYENRWEESYLLLSSRDLILTMDRMGKLYDYSFDRTFLSLFLDKIIPTNKTNLLSWSDVEGTIQERVIVACNCTENQINQMNFWFSGLKVNGREIKILFPRSTLESIPQDADVLFIWGYKPLDSYLANFQDYLRRDVGIVEMMDFTYQATGNKVDVDRVQREIFGLKWIDVEKGPSDYMVFSRRPTNSTDIIYGPYKYFYHVPILLNTSSTETISGCDYRPSAVGSLTFNKTGYKFWICSGNSVWFDTDANNTKDTLVYVDGSVKIGGYNFTLNYVEDNQSISVSFKPDYKFADFLTYIRPEGEPEPPGKALGIYRIPHIEPIDDNAKRVLIYAISGSPPRKYPAVILNASVSRVAWIADFTEDGIGDDEKTLFLSLLLWASKKKTTPSIFIRSGFSTSYINVKNRDMYEVYKFSLGLAYPY